MITCLLRCVFAGDAYPRNISDAIQIQHHISLNMRIMTQFSTGGRRAYVAVSDSFCLPNFRGNACI